MENDLQGTLDLLILKTLAQNSSLHGYGIVLHIERVFGELLRVGEGSSPDGTEQLAPFHLGTH